MTDFLLGFSASVVQALLERGQLELTATGTLEGVVRHVAAHLGSAQPGHSLVSRFVQGLLASPDVDELFVDDDELTELIQDLGLRG
ncbi:MAG: hypothetical protein ACI8PZ_000986 [Myxococcota bacterium]|jgi:hypothetical protein